MAIKRNRVGKVFGEVLRKARAEANATQEALAEAADFKTNYVSMLESALRQPTITTLIAFEQALDLPPGELSRRTIAAMDGKRLALPIRRRSGR